MLGRCNRLLTMSAAVLAGRRTRADFLTNYIRKGSPGLMQAIDVVFLHIGAAVFAAVAYAS